MSLVGAVTDSEMMTAAIGEAKKALAHDDVPIGAVVVLDGKVIGRGHNRREVDADPSGHAEVVAIRDAARTLGRSRLDGAVLATTLEPCPMCAGAIWLARIERVVFGAYDPKAGALVSLYELGSDSRLNHNYEVTGGVLETECAALLKDFFKARRATHRQN